MSWAEVLTINSNPRKPLDQSEYDLFYELCKVINKGYGTKDSEVLIVPEQDTVSAGAYDGGSMKIAIIPSTVNDILTGAFGNCTNLISVAIPFGVMAVDGGAFLGCSSLKSIKLPRTIRYIGISAFPSGLEHIYVPWSEGDVEGAPWGANNAVIHYNYV